MKKFTAVTLTILMLLSALVPGTGIVLAADTDAAPVIACWGDSLTYGAQARAGASYPDVLAKLSGLEVVNMGVSGETSVTIAARQGAYDIKLKKDVTIPADTSDVEIEFEAYNSDGSFAGVIVPRSMTDGGWNPCTINGVEGTMSIGVNTSGFPRTLDWAKFKRKTAGTAVEAPAGTKITVGAEAVAANADINIFYTGTNGG